MPSFQIWAEAGVSRSRSLLNFINQSLYCFQVRSWSLGYEAEARLFVGNQMHFFFQCKPQIRKPQRLTFLHRNQVWRTGFEFVSPGIELDAQDPNSIPVETNSNPDGRTRFLYKKVSLRGFRTRSQKSWSLWSQAPKKIGSRSLDPKKAGFVKVKPALAHIWNSVRCKFWFTWVLSVLQLTVEKDADLVGD